MPKGVYGNRSELQQETSRKLGLSRKGITPYEQTEETKYKISKSLKGNVPVNKGKQTEKVLKKNEKLKLGLPIDCKIHGEHLKWRMHSDNNVQCMHCAAHWQRERKKRMPLEVIFKHARGHCKKNKRNFDIKLEDLYEKINLQGNKCALCDVIFDEDNLPSIDRIDSSLGYTKDNIQLVLIKVNRMKTDLSQDEFVDLCEKISKRRKGVNNG